MDSETLLSPKAATFYLTQQEIDATHPLESGAYAEDEAAMQLVHERTGKRELVDLVRTLIMRAHAANSVPIASLKELRRYRSGTVAGGHPAVSATELDRLIAEHERQEVTQ